MGGGKEKQYRRWRVWRGRQSAFTFHSRAALVRSMEGRIEGFHSPLVEISQLTHSMPYSQALLEFSSSLSPRLPHPLVGLGSPISSRPSVNRIRDREARTGLRITNWSVPCRQRGCGDEGMDRSGWTPGHDAQRSKRVHGELAGSTGEQDEFCNGSPGRQHPSTPNHTLPHLSTPSPACTA